MKNLWKEFPKSKKEIDKTFPTNCEYTILIRTSLGKEYHENPLGLYFGGINTPSYYKELCFKTVQYDSILEEFVPLYIYGGRTSDFYKNYISLLERNLKIVEKGFDRHPPLYFSLEDIDEYILIEDLKTGFIAPELDWKVNNNLKEFESNLCEGHKTTTIFFQSNKGIHNDWNPNGIFYGYTWNPEETNIKNTYLESFDWSPTMDDYRGMTIVSKNSNFLDGPEKSSTIYLEDINKYVMIDKDNL